MASAQTGSRPRVPLTTAQVVPWVVRVVWVGLPFAVGPALADALDGLSVPVRAVASTGLWVGWSLGMVASFVALPASLTTLRVLAPAGLAAVAVGAVGGHGSPLAAAWAALALVWVLSPPFGAWCVNGPAYPNERRYLLRAPGALLAGPLVLAWAVAVAGACAGPLLLAARQWIGGAVALLVGVPAAVVLARAMHNLSRRWAVFVPAGLVLHDPMTLVDPVLFRRQMVEVMQPAGVEGDAVDLTQAAPGLALELELAEPVSLSLMKPGQRLGETRTTTRVLFTPTRPGAVLEDARSRRFRVG